MHKHTVDWYSRIHITRDAALAQKRWDTATALAESADRATTINLLKQFLLPSVPGTITSELTSRLLDIDSEFPVRDNAQELRLIAGLAMVTTFDDPGKATIARKYALGLQSAQFPAGRFDVIEPEMVSESVVYLNKHSARLRPDDFSTMSREKLTAPLNKAGQVIDEAFAAGDLEKRNAAETRYRSSIAQTISRSHRDVGRRIEQLAEECQLLWWALGQYSDSLALPTDELSAKAYALPAAAEAAARTRLIPPPPSIKPLLAKVLRHCKSPTGDNQLADYIKSTDTTWRETQTSASALFECRELVPLTTALALAQERGVAAGLRNLPTVCHGVRGTLRVHAVDAAYQLYNELMFLRALDEQVGSA